MPLSPSTHIISHQKHKIWVFVSLVLGFIGLHIMIASDFALSFEQEDQNDNKIPVVSKILPTTITNTNNNRINLEDNMGKNSSSSTIIDDRTETTTDLEETTTSLSQGSSDSSSTTNTSTSTLFETTASAPQEFTAPITLELTQSTTASSAITSGSESESIEDSSTTTSSTSSTNDLVPESTNPSESQLTTETIVDDVPKYSILPKKIYTVAGLEDSGTKFVTSVIAGSLGLKQRNGSKSCSRKTTGCEENTEIQVHHISLPAGSTCTSYPNPKVIDVILPPECSRQKSTSEIKIIQECNQMAKDLWDFEPGASEVAYLKRYQINLVTQKEWYDEQGVEQYLILVIRDKTISKTARNKAHCKNLSLLEKEEEVGTNILIDVINKYILEENGDEGQQTKLTYQNYDTWNAKVFQTPGRNHRSLSLSGGLPMKNNVVLVSYESMMKLGQPYVKVLYNTLGIDSDYMPSILDGNEKYVKKGRGKLHFP